MSDLKNPTTEYTPPAPRGDGDSRPLPKGWIKQFDSRSNAWFYVDTTASPPRSIWVHPYDDPEYLESHPNVKNYESPPEYGRSPSPPPVPTTSRPKLNNHKGKAPEKRGFLGKLVDKAIGTKEERDAAKRHRDEERELEREERYRRQQAHAAQYGAPPQVRFQGHPGASFQQAGFQQGGYQQGPYQPAGYQQAGYPQGYQPGYGQQVYAQPQPARGGGLGGGGMAIPLLGGLAGGLLLGDMLGGDGGDFGGGDF